MVMPFGDFAGDKLHIFSKAKLRTRHKYNREFTQGIPVFHHYAEMRKMY